MHINFLHYTGSRNPLGIKRDHYKIPFHSYFRSKDLFGFVIAVSSLFFISFYARDVLGDPDNYIAANPIRTPAHIKPE